MYETISPVIRTYGVFEMFEQLGRDVSDRLKEVFPDIYREIKTVALLGLVYGCSPRLMKRCFEDSYLADLYPDIGTCANSDSYARKGDNPEHSQEKQVRLLYLFDSGSHAPVFYRMVPGNIADKTAMADTIKLSGIKNCTIIGDKGFYSKKNVSFLIKRN